MALTRSFSADTNLANQIGLNWLMPLDFNNTTDELIITRTSNHFPMELFNATFPTRATDSRPIRIFEGQTIVGTDTGNISVVTNVLTDTGATFPTSPSLKGRCIRDTSSKVHRILSNTSTAITIVGTSITDGKYVVMPDFPTETRIQENYIIDARTTVGAGFIKDLVVIENNALLVKEFTQDEVANMIFRDGAGTILLIKRNTSDTIFFFETAVTPVIGSVMATLASFNDSQPLDYIDNFNTVTEADTRTGTGLLVIQ